MTYYFVPLATRKLKTKRTIILGRTTKSSYGIMATKMTYSFQNAAYIFSRWWYYGFLCLYSWKLFDSESIEECAIHYLDLNSRFWSSKLLERILVHFFFFWITMYIGFVESYYQKHFLLIWYFYLNEKIYKTDENKLRPQKQNHMKKAYKTTSTKKNKNCMSTKSANKAYQKPT